VQSRSYKLNYDTLDLELMIRVRLGLAHLLIAGNDTVPISMWHGGVTHSTECPVFITVITFLFLTPIQL